MRYLLTALLLAVVCVPLQAAAQEASSTAVAQSSATVATNAIYAQIMTPPEPSQDVKQAYAKLGTDRMAFKKQQQAEEKEFLKTLKDKKVEDARTQYIKFMKRQKEAELDFKKKQREELYEIEVKSRGEYEIAISTRVAARKELSAAEKSSFLGYVKEKGRAWDKQRKKDRERNALEREKIEADASLNRKDKRKALAELRQKQEKRGTEETEARKKTDGSAEFWSKMKR